MSRKVSVEQLQVIVDPPLPGDRNMAIDRFWLESAESLEQPLTVVRFYQWNTPTVSLGAHQKAAEAVDLDFCSEAGIPVVARPTGGRAVLHGDELTYSVVSSDGRMFSFQGIMPVYRLIAECLARGLEHLGIQVAYSSGKRRSNGGPVCDWTKPCFTSSSRHELAFRGRKLVGSAQRRLRGSFLQHGSIPLSMDYELMGRALRVEAGMLRKNMISISEAAGRRVTFEELASALEFSFRQRIRSDRFGRMAL